MKTNKEILKDKIESLRKEINKIPFWKFWKWIPIQSQIDHYLKLYKEELKK